MSVTEFFFYLIASLAVAGAGGVVFARNTVYAALFLIAALLAVAGVYILLGSEFLALVQVLIYGGAVTVILVFVLMLTRADDLPEAMVGAQWPLAGLASIALVGLLIAAGVTSDWPGDVGETAVIPFETLGDALFLQWAVPFEIASLVLLVALIGAIILARGEEGE